MAVETELKDAAENVDVFNQTVAILFARKNINQTFFNLVAKDVNQNFFLPFLLLAHSAHLFLHTCALPHTPTDGVARIFP